MIRKRSISAKDLNVKAEKALKSAIHKLIAARKRQGQPLIIWQKGRIVRVPAKKLVS